MFMLILLGLAGSSGLLYLARRGARARALMADLQGPKLRVGTFADGPVHLAEDQSFRLDLDPHQAQPLDQVEARPAARAPPAGVSGRCTS